MRHYPILLCVGFPIVLSVCGSAGCSKQSAAAGAVPTDSEQQLVALERETGDRWKRKDVAFFDQMMDDDIVMNLPDGSLQTKKEFLASLRSDYRVDVATNDEIVVHLHGTTAVVTGVVHNVGVFEGTPFDSRLRYVDTFVWTGDKWKDVGWSMVNTAPAHSATAP